MATKTSLLGLTKPAYTEAADIAVLNTNFDLIDKAVGNGARGANLLGNSYFPSAYVINQRGKTQYTGNVYTIDRWRTYSSTAVINVGAAGINPQTSALLQYLDIDPGKTYTAAICYADGTVSVQTGTFTAGFGSTSSGINCSVSNEYCRFLIRESASYIRWAALYEGAYTAETLPAYVYKGYAAELAECQLYYENSWYGGNTHRQNQTMGYAVDSTRLDSYIYFKQTKRVAPTVTLSPYNPGTYTNWVYYNGTYKEAATMTTVARGGNIGFMVRLTSASGDALTKGTCYAMDGHWEASADL